MACESIGCELLELVEELLSTRGLGASCATFSETLALFSYGDNRLCVISYNVYDRKDNAHEIDQNC